MISKRLVTRAKRTKLSKNFTLWEVIRSNHDKLVVWPNLSIQAYLKLGTDMILQPIRDEWGPVHVNSGYRNPRINRAVGGSRRSDHMAGAAFDIVIRNHPPVQIWTWIKESAIYYRQVIWYRKGRFVHVSFNYPGQRFKRQALVFNK